MGWKLLMDSRKILTVDLLVVLHAFRDVRVDDVANVVFIVLESVLANVALHHCANVGDRFAHVVECASVRGIVVHDGKHVARQSDEEAREDVGHTASNHLEIGAALLALRLRFATMSLELCVGSDVEGEALDERIHVERAVAPLVAVEEFEYFCLDREVHGEHIVKQVC